MVGNDSISVLRGLIKVASTMLVTVTVTVTAPGVVAQAPAELSIQDASQMAPINQALKQGYQGPTEIDVAAIDPEASVAAVVADEAELAAISRPLTPAEKAKGLEQRLITREKIAIAVTTDNPFNQSLTVAQINQVFQGTLTNWSQLGGSNRPLKVLNRSAKPNAVQALQEYDSIASLATGTAPPGTEDLSAALGPNGITFVLASELAAQPKLRALPMYGLLPDDPKYPFSQAFTYVYRADNQAAVQPFLQFAESDAGQRAIAKAITTPQAFAPLPAALPQASSPDTANSGSLDWLPIGLGILGLGVLAGITLKATQKAHQKENIPRPAPNYAERIKPSHLSATELGTRETNVTASPPASEDTTET